MFGTYELLILLALFAGGALFVGGVVAAVIFVVRSQGARVRNPGEPHDPMPGGTVPADSIVPVATHSHEGSAAASSGHTHDPGYAPDSGGYTHGGCDASFSGGDSGGGSGGGGGD